MSYDGNSLDSFRPSHKVAGTVVPVLTPMEKQLPVREIRIPYTPRPQFLPYHKRKQRFALTVAHRRCGKTVAEVNEGGKKIAQCGREFPPPQVAFVSPTFGQSKRNAWPYAKHYFAAVPGLKVREGDLTLEFPGGGKYIFAGSDNYDSLRGLYLDHVSLDEFGSQDPRVWGEVVRPALSDYAGSATFIGSAHGRNHFYDLLQQHKADPDWLITILKASETGILTPEELRDARMTMTEEQYRQEYECDFDAAVTGTFYGREIDLAYQQNRISRVLHDRHVDTYAGWDLGKGSNMALWVFQRVGVEWHFIDYYEGAKPEHGLEEAASWVKSRPYRIDEHFLPHDAAATELMTRSTTRVQFLEGRGLRCTVLRRTGLEDGIASVRVNFNQFFIDSSACAHGLDSLRMYRAEWDDKKKIFSDRPVHDWASHAADALRTCVMAQPEPAYRKDWSQPISRNIPVV